MAAHTRRGFAELLADRRGQLDAPHYPEQVAAIVGAMVHAFRNKKKVLWCGNGGSAADAQHLAAEFSGRFLRERGGLPSEALSVNTSALTAIANDFGYDNVFARQVEAFTLPGDVALLAGVLVLTATSLGLFWAPAMAMLSDAAEAHRLDQGLAAALMNIAWAAGQILGSGGGGAAAKIDGDGLPVAITAGVLAATLAVLVLMARRPRARRGRQTADGQGGGIGR